jgi:hypothetical protein
MNEQKRFEGFERDPFIRYLAMNEQQAWDAFGSDRTERVVDAGPADATRYRKGARLYHIYLKGGVGATSKTPNP